MRLIYKVLNCVVEAGGTAVVVDCSARFDGRKVETGVYVVECDDKAKLDEVVTWAKDEMLSGKHASLDRWFWGVIVIGAIAGDWAVTRRGAWLRVTRGDERGKWVASCEQGLVEF